MAEYIDRKKMLSKVKTNYIEDAENGYDYYDYLLQDDLMAEPQADVIERSKIDKAIEEMEIEYNNFEYTENHNKGASYGIRKSIEILKRNIGE